MISNLQEAGAKVVGYTSFFIEPQVDQGLVYIHKLAEFYRALHCGRELVMDGKR